MADTIAKMSKAELRELIESAIEEKLLELFGDPDEGLQVRKDVLALLRRQNRRIARGERGKPLAQVIRRLGLE